ncbi:MAG: recombinase family protein [Dysosmobacter sp.]|nr:recombinase family protein [Dysosmobacter sp.]
MREQQNYRAAIYCRLSSEDGTDHESMSIGNQRALLTEYVGKQGWEVVDTYIDDGYSGTNFDRPGFQRMIADIERGRVNLVITKDLSRLGRNYIMCGQYTEIYFPERHVRYIALNDGVDTLNQTSSMDITPFRHILNDMYARDISTKIKSTLHTKAKRGEYLGALDPYGYLRHPDDKHKLIINEETAPIVRRMFEMCAAGMGARSIATKLNTEGILSPTEYTRFRKHNPDTDGEFVRKGFWTRTYVQFMLKNEIYVGSMVQGRQYTPSYRSKKREPIPKEDWIVVPNMHEPIVSRELFDEAQEKLKTRKKVCTGPSDLPHLFSGLFFCEACGSSMHLGYTQKRKYIYYSCAKSTAIGSVACSTHYINYNTLYQVVQEDIKRNAILFSEDREQTTKRLMELKCADEQKQASKMRNELAAAEKRLAELDVKLKRTYEDNINGKLPDHIFSMFISDYDAEKEALKATIANIRKSLEKVRDTAADIDRFAKLIQKYTSFEELDRFMLNELIERITIYETPGMGRYRKGKEKIITIYYKFVGTLQ